MKIYVAAVEALTKKERLMYFFCRSFFNLTLCMTKLSGYWCCLFLTLRISLLSKRISPHQMVGLLKCKNGEHFAFSIFSNLPNRCPLGISQERAQNYFFSAGALREVKAPRGVPEISTPQAPPQAAPSPGSKGISLHITCWG